MGKEVTAPLSQSKLKEKAKIHLNIVSYTQALAIYLYKD